MIVLLFQLLETEIFIGFYSNLGEYTIEGKAIALIQVGPAAAKW